MTHNTNLLYPSQSVAEFSQADIDSRITGSIYGFTQEQFTLSTSWSIKGCLLLLYSRMTTGYAVQHLLVKIFAIYCVIGYLVIEITLLAAWCHPISQYWAVPVMNQQCATYHNHLLTTAVFNISADVGILMIPMPIIARSKFPTRQ
jgi:hypothetical protein